MMRSPEKSLVRESTATEYLGPKSSKMVSSSIICFFSSLTSSTRVQTIVEGHMHPRIAVDVNNPKW